MAIINQYHLNIQWRRKYNYVNVINVNAMAVQREGG